MGEGFGLAAASSWLLQQSPPCSVLGPAQAGESRMNVGNLVCRVNNALFDCAALDCEELAESLPQQL